MEAKNQMVNFKTSDGVTIVGDFFNPSGATSAVLLLHMMPATRVSWFPLSEALNKSGIATLAIDLRGHGQSVLRGGEKLNYKNFSDAEYQAGRLDVDAAMEFLMRAHGASANERVLWAPRVSLKINSGFTENQISLVGASIGANLSLDALYRYSSTRRAVLLSPGLNYRGVTTEPPMRGLAPDQKVWLVAAEGDDYSAASVRALHHLQPKTSTLTVFPGADHGTTLFTSQRKLIDDIVDFLASRSV